MDKPDPTVRVTKNTFSQLSVKYPCPQCGEKLSSKAASAGGRDTCPACQASFVVPGAENVALFNEQEARRAHEQQVQKAADRRAMEAAETARQIEEELDEIASVERNKKKARREYQTEVYDAKRSSVVTSCMRSCHALLGASFWCVTIVAASGVVVSLIVAFRADNLLEGMTRVAVGIITAIVVWVAHVVFLGLFGVLFEIEKNTRAMRLELDHHRVSPFDDDDEIDLTDID